MIKIPLPKRVAIVTPWFGKDLLGGAEQQAYQIALRLSQRGHAVTVLTTCCRSFHDDWSINHLPPGKANEYGIDVVRFPVDARDSVAFETVIQELLSLPHGSIREGINRLTSSDVEVFTKDNINSSALIKHLAAVHTDFDAFIFIPYMFGVIFQGLPVVADRSFLQPCLHDEAYAYLPQIQNLFRLAKRLLFNSGGELQVANRIYGPGILLRSLVVGEGVESPVPTQTEQLPPGLQDSRFVLYLGRRDVTKNVPLLVEAFKRFKHQHPRSNTKLVLAGPGSASWQDLAGGLVDLGAVSDSEKLVLLNNCLALFQPSTNESYSRVMMEAWQAGRPVVVNAGCLATAHATEQSGGGWLASTESEWADMFAKIESTPEQQLSETGRRGAAYAMVHADWNNVIDRYEAVFNDPPPVNERSRKLAAIHQLLPDLSFGDAISNQAILIRDRLRALGYASEIFVTNLDKRVQDQAHVFMPGSVEPSAGLIYHHSIGTALTTVAIKHSGPKLLIYHNITPAEFFRPYRPGFAWMLETGRNDLRRLSQFFPNSVGDSAFNAAELSNNGFRDPGVLPIAVTPDRWNIPVNNDLLATLAGETKNILFVGRIAPNKMQDRLIKAFASLQKLVADSRLILVGYGSDSDPYQQVVNETISELGLVEHVLMPGQVSDNDLLAYYQSADLLWSMSEHEGFCVPIVEAMWFDVPVLAYSAAAVSETLADAGVMFDHAHELTAVAAKAREMIVDESLRRRVIASQRNRRESFLPEVTWARLDQLLDRLEA
ncbi:MAG TPA: glycosyltransferase [Pyrinomonadaceae bacterium]|nr:glycosyltransferase [Pyrinomonadaceae bacterium]